MTGTQKRFYSTDQHFDLQCDGCSHIHSSISQLHEQRSVGNAVFSYSNPQVSFPYNQLHTHDLGQAYQCCAEDNCHGCHETTFAVTKSYGLDTDQERSLYLHTQHHTRRGGSFADPQKSSKNQREKIGQHDRVGSCKHTSRPKQEKPIY